jgi:hypothetical protein
MSDIISNAKGGEFATARRGGMDLDEVHFAREKLLNGVSIMDVARMLGRSTADVMAVAVQMPRRERKPFVPAGPPKMPVTFQYGHLPPKRKLDVLAKQVAERHHLTVDQLRGQDRTNRVVHPRQEFMWLANKAGYSTTTVGRYLGDRDHTTVIHGVRRHQERLDAKFPQEATAA